MLFVLLCYLSYQAICNIAVCNLQDRNFLSPNLKNSHFVSCKMQDSNFLPCNLQGSSTLSCNFQGTNFLSCNLHDSSSLSCNLQYRKFLSRNLQNSALLLCNLQDRNLQSCFLLRLKSRNVRDASRHPAFMDKRPTLSHTCELNEMRTLGGSMAL